MDTYPRVVSRNPGAGPKGPAEYVREQTLDGEQLVGFMPSVIRDEKINGPKPTVNHMMDATISLAARGW